MKTKIFVFFIAILNINTVFSQSKAAKKPAKASNNEREISAEAGAIFNQAFRLFGLVTDKNAYAGSPYFVAYKQHLKGKNLWLRAGLGGSFSDVAEQSGQFADVRITSNLNADVRIGLEKQKKVAEKQTLTWGFDLRGGYAMNKIENNSGFDRSIRSNGGFSVGTNIVLGYRYHFSEVFSIGTEMWLQYLYAQSVQDLKFTANPQFNQKISTTFDNKIDFKGPANIFLTYHF